MGAIVAKLNAMTARSKVLFGGGLAAVLLGFVVVVSFVAGLNTVRNEGIDKETALVATYADTQNTLSAFISGFYEQVGVADAKSDKLDQILIDAVSGRYDNGSAPSDAYVSVMVEAYPQLGTLDVYDKIVDYVAAGRASFKNQQSRLLDAVRDYKLWKDKGFIHSWQVDITGFPSPRLSVKDGGGAIVTGEAALAMMERIILDSRTVDAYQTGELEPLTIPAG